MEQRGELTALEGVADFLAKHHHSTQFINQELALEPRPVWITTLMLETSNIHGHMLGAAEHDLEHTYVYSN